MPVIFVKAVPVDKRDLKGVYECPLYRTRQRGPTVSLDLDSDSWVSLQDGLTQPSKTWTHFI
jgi:hypothetical protein